MTPRTPISARRKFLFISALVLAGVFGAAVAGGALIYTDTIRFGWSERLRRQSRIRKAAAKENRALILGDSFLVPWPIVHCLGKDLESYFRERNVGLLNTGIGGYGPYEYADQMNLAAESFRPNLVILFYFAGNDLTDVMYRPDATPRRPSGAAPVVDPPAKTSEIRPFRNLLWFTASIQLAQNSAGAPAAPTFDWDEMIRHGIDPDLIRRAKAAIADPGDVGKGHVNPYALLLALGSPSYLEDNLLMESEGSRLARRTVEAKLGEIAAKARELGAELFVVAIPASVQLDRSHFEFYSKAKYRVDDRLLEARAPQQMLREFCMKRGIPFLDLLPVFKEHGDTAALYWEYDDHLSEAGHKVAFEAVRAELLDPWIGGRK